MEIVYGEFLKKLISRGVFSVIKLYGNESTHNPANQLKEYNGFDTRAKPAFQNHIVLKKRISLTLEFQSSFSRLNVNQLFTPRGLSEFLLYFDTKNIYIK